MAISVVQNDDLNKTLELLASSEVTILYIVDSYGALYPRQTRSVLKNFLHHAGSGGKQVGIHIHNNRQLALANTLEAIDLKANMLDASMAGCGRGAGNCQMELLMSFLHNPKYRLRPVLECILYHIEPLRDKFLWGYDIPYMLTGLLNIHPGAAMQFNLGRDKGDIVKLFNLLATREEG